MIYLLLDLLIYFYYLYLSIELHWFFIIIEYGFTIQSLIFWCFYWFNLLFSSSFIKIINLNESLLDCSDCFWNCFYCLLLYYLKNCSQLFSFRNHQNLCWAILIIDLFYLEVKHLKLKHIANFLFFYWIFILNLISFILLIVNY